MEEKQLIHLDKVCRLVLNNGTPHSININDFNTIFFSDDVKISTQRLEDYFDNIFIFTKKFENGIFEIWQKYERKLTSEFTPGSPTYQVMNELFNEIGNKAINKDIHDVISEKIIDGRLRSCKFHRIFPVDYKDLENNGDFKPETMVDNYVYIQDSLK